MWVIALASAAATATEFGIDRSGKIPPGKQTSFSPFQPAGAFVTSEAGWFALRSKDLSLLTFQGH